MWSHLTSITSILTSAAALVAPSIPTGCQGWRRRRRGNVRNDGVKSSADRKEPAAAVQRVGGHVSAGMGGHDGVSLPDKLSLC